MGLAFVAIFLKWFDLGTQIQIPKCSQNSKFKSWISDLSCFTLNDIHMSIIFF